MSPLPASSSSSADRAQPNAAIVYLSGPLRGKTVRVQASTLRLLPRTGELLPPNLVGDEGDTVSLHRAGDAYELVASREHGAWINGQRVEREASRTLRSGDMIEIESGPVLRFRIHAPGVSPHKSLAEVFADCFDEARHAPQPVWAQMPRMMRAMVRELATQTSLWFRVGAAVLIVALGAVIAYQSLRTYDLQRRLMVEQERVAGLAGLLRRLEEQNMTREELGALRSELSRGLFESAERIRALEAGSAAVRRIIAESAGSVAFIQGSFGFEDPDTRRPLRFAVNEKGEPVRLPDGRPLITLEGNGPPIDVGFAGTAFLVSRDGALLTNRHVARPWEDEESLPAIRQLGLKPVMRRLRGFVPGAPEPFEVRFVASSDSHDIALLRGDGTVLGRSPLRLAGTVPAAGDTAILLGYPTGVRALLARAGDAFVKSLGGRANLDPHSVARALARADLIQPLASRGIVGQVSGEAIVYDAETTAGGSGGPVFNLAGEVMAINRAVLPEFGGSNIGVPIRHALTLLERHDVRREP